MEWLSWLGSIDQFLIKAMVMYGPWAYGLLFCVIFCETGLVMLPFLPGDSVLFLAGSLAGQSDSSLQIGYLFMSLLVASIAGNQLNYHVGRWMGKQVFDRPDRWFLKQKHLQKTQHFYERYGKLTIVLARFMPIIRTFAPFVAGVARMHYATFTLFNVLSAVLWIGSLLVAGYFLGQIAFVQAHLSLCIYSIVALSLLPSIVLWVRHRYCEVYA